MPDTKDSALAELTAIADNDLLYGVDVSDTTMAVSGTSKRMLADRYREYSAGVVRGLLAGSANAGSNTTTIQARLDAADAAGGGVVVIPVGTWYVNNTLAIGARTILAGLGWGSKIVLADGTSTDAAHKAVIMAKGNTNYVGVRDLYIDGNAAGQTGDTTYGSVGIDFYSRGTTEGVGAPVYDGGLWVENVMVFNCKGTGFYLRGDSTTIRATRCYAYHNSNEGFYGKTDCIFADCVAGNNGGDGFLWYAGTSITVGNCKSFGSGARYSAGDFTVLYSNTVTMTGCLAEDSCEQGFRITASSHVTLVGCQAYRMGDRTGIQDTYRSGFWIEDDGAGNLCKNVALRGCSALGGGSGGMNYALTTRNLGVGVEIDLRTESLAVGIRNHLGGNDQGRIVVNGAVLLDTITTQAVNAQTGTTYTPLFTDINALVTLDNTGAITVTLPQDSALAVPVNARIDFAQLNTGQVTFAAGTGATVNGYPGLKIAARYGVVSAVKRAANTWLLTGALSA